MSSFVPSSPHVRTDATCFHHETSSTCVIAVSHGVCACVCGCVCACMCLCLYSCQRLVGEWVGGWRAFIIIIVFVLANTVVDMIFCIVV